MAKSFENEHKEHINGGRTRTVEDIPHTHKENRKYKVDDSQNFHKNRNKTLMDSMQAHHKADLDNVLKPKQNKRNIVVVKKNHNIAKKVIRNNNFQNKESIK